MTLAFRAAAGEIPTPDDAFANKMKQPWESIDADNVPSSEECCSLLEQQIRLLEGAVLQLDKDQRKREEYIKDANKRRIENSEES
mmetsp:Transcript_18924/g.27693  ORF Transcript_18924/g.27693 Transcript_18924/m.27693 type:complete len:85 (-) Transcript_18924:563-817(-)